MKFLCLFYEQICESVPEAFQVRGLGGDVAVVQLKVIFKPPDLWLRVCINVNSELFFLQKRHNLHWPNAVRYYFHKRAL